MTIIRAVVQFQGRSGLAEDIFQNVWHFVSAAEAKPTDYAAIGGVLDDFYSVAPPAVGSTSIASRMAGQAISDAAKPHVDYYHVDPATNLTGSPKGGSDLLAFVPAATTAFPNEVALAMSYHADLTNLAEIVPGGPAGPVGDIRPKARARGRLFIGPLVVDAGIGGPVGNVPTAAFVAAVQDRARWVRDSATLAAAGIKWSTYSRVARQPFTVVGGWVDNAWDIQRRRGIGASARGTW